MRANNSERVFAESAFGTAEVAAIEHQLGSKVAKYWVWLAAGAPYLPATARAAAVALGVGLGGVPLLQRIKLQAKALRFCLKRRSLIKRYRQLRLDLAELLRDQGGLRLDEFDAFPQSGPLGVAKASEEGSKRAD